MSVTDHLYFFSDKKKKERNLVVWPNICIFVSRLTNLYFEIFSDERAYAYQTPAFVTESNQSHAIN